MKNKEMKDILRNIHIEHERTTCTVYTLTNPDNPSTSTALDNIEKEQGEVVHLSSIKESLFFS